MFDSRFPNLFRVSEAPGLSLELRAKAVAFVDAVVARVPGVKGVCNVERRELFFYFIDPSGGPLAVPLVGEDAWPLDQRDQDDAVALLRLALEPLAKRERRRAVKEAQDRKDAEELKQKTRAERRPGIQEHADYVSRKRRGLQKTYGYVERPSGLAVPHVNGAMP